MLSYFPLVQMLIWRIRKTTLNIDDKFLKFSLDDDSITIIIETSFEIMTIWIVLILWICKFRYNHRCGFMYMFSLYCCWTLCWNSSFVAMLTYPRNLRSFLFTGRIFWNQYLLLFFLLFHPRILRFYPLFNYDAEFKFFQLCKLCVVPIRITPIAMIRKSRILLFILI